MLKRAFGYQGDAMALPVADVEAAVPFYENLLGFRVLAREDTPLRAVVLARDDVQMRLVENGGDPSQDGCAFHVEGLQALLMEFQAKGVVKADAAIGSERQEDGSSWQVFYVVAPDGLCYWFGERA